MSIENIFISAKLNLHEYNFVVILGWKLVIFLPHPVYTVYRWLWMGEWAWMTSWLTIYESSLDLEVQYKDIEYTYTFQTCTLAKKMNLVQHFTFDQYRWANLFLPLNYSNNPCIDSFLLNKLICSVDEKTKAIIFCYIVILIISCWLLWNLGSI